jgi:DNA-binding GntR family transcriptional regulator
VSPRATAWGAYKDITVALRTRITNGVFPPGSALPSESTLCAQFNVSRNTMRRALAQLADEGMVAVRPGRDRVVVPPGDSAAPSVPQYRTMAADLRTMIESGELGPGDALPSESALARRYTVARETARRALAELEGAGLIDAVHGKGRYVRRR